MAPVFGGFAGVIVWNKRRETRGEALVPYDDEVTDSEAIENNHETEISEGFLAGIGFGFGVGFGLRMLMEGMNGLNITPNEAQPRGSGGGRLRGGRHERGYGGGGNPARGYGGGGRGYGGGGRGGYGGDCRYGSGGGSDGNWN